MPVTNTSAISGPFIPNGVATDFPFDFKAGSPAEVIVVDEDGVEISSALYSATVNSNEGGTVSFSAAPADAGPSFYIVSAPLMTQGADFGNAGPSFNPTSLTRAIDHAAIRDLALRARIDAYIPQVASVAVGARAGKFLSYGPTGLPIFASGTGSDAGLRTDMADSAIGTSLLAVSTGLAGQVTTDLSEYLLAAAPVPFELLGGVGDGDDVTPTDNGPMLAAASSVTGHIRLKPGLTYAITTTAAIARDDFVLEVPRGATLKILVDGKGLRCTGERITICGGGRILGPDNAFDGSIPSASPTKGLIFFEGDHGSVFDLELFNIPRNGVAYNNCIPGTVSNVRFIGNFPYATSGILTHSLTGQIGVYWNPPASGGTTTPEGNAVLKVIGCYFETCIQGIQCATWNGGYVRLQSTGNTFSQCWDHGIYIILGYACSSVGDTFLNCALPLVFDQIVGGTITGLTCYSNETGRINADQGVELRDCEDIVIDGFMIKGRAASIHCVSLLSGAASKLNRIKIRNGLISRAGIGVWTGAPKFAILFNSAEQCEDCEIVGITVTGTGYPSAEPPIAMWMGGSNRGKRNAIRNVKLVYGDALANQTVFGIWPDNQDDFIAEDNEVYFTSDGTGTNALSGFNVTDTNGVFRGNTVKYLSGGANVEGRGFTMGGTYTALDIFGNTIDLQEAATQQIFAVNAGSPRVRANLINGDELRGTVTIANGASTGNESNDCARASFSRVVGLVPQSAAAAALASSVGVYPTVTNGTVTLTTGDGSNAPANCQFAYVLD